MVDQELSEPGKPDPLEDSIRSLTPQPLAVSAGTVMFESGRAVGREEAMAESRKTASRSLTVWRIATAASLALALFGLSGIFNSTSLSTSGSVAEHPAPQELVEGVADSDDKQNVEMHETKRSINVSQFVQTKRNLPTNERTIIGIRNRLTNPVFESDFDRPKPNASFVNSQPQTAFELMQQYTDSGAL